MTKTTALMTLLILSVSLRVSTGLAGGYEEGAEPPENLIASLEALVNAGNLQTALDTAEAALVERGDDVSILLIKGTTLRKLKRHVEAIHTYEKVLALDPDNQLSRNHQAMLLMAQARKADENSAPELVTRALDVSQGDPGILEEAIAILASCGKCEDAARLFQADPSLATRSPAVAKTVAACCREQGASDLAAELYASVLSHDPVDKVAILGLTETRMAMDRLDDALATVQQGLAHDPDDPDLLLASAAIHTKTGDLLPACADLDRILAREPAHEQVLRQKATCLRQLGCISLVEELAKAHPAALAPDMLRGLEQNRREADATWADAGAPNAVGDSLFTAISYQDIPARAPTGSDMVDRSTLIQHIELLKRRGLQFVGGQDILAARRLKRSLPNGSVMLVFEGPYKTFQANVLPVLEQYKCPALLAVCSSWLENGAPPSTPPLLSWSDVRLLTTHPLITIASLSHDLNRRVRTGMAGDTAWAATSRIYNDADQTYEDDRQYRARLSEDFKLTKNHIRVRTGTEPHLLLWPFGVYNTITLRKARLAGLATLPDLQQNGRAAYRKSARDRWRVMSDAGLPAFARGFVEVTSRSAAPKRETLALRVEMDALNGNTAEAVDEAVELLLQRAKQIPVDTIYLTAHSDADGDGVAEGVYFPCRVLPTKQDLLARVTARIRANDIEVRICMPVLALKLPSNKAGAGVLVHESNLGILRPSHEPRTRLSPFSTKALKLVKEVYGDLAAHVELDGIVFLEDAFLTDTEDFHPEALEQLRSLGTTERNVKLMTKPQRAQWAAMKTQQLDGFIGVLSEAVREYRPDASFTRALFAPSLHDPDAAAWLGQVFERALYTYDHVLLLADPEGEGVGRPAEWLASLARKAQSLPSGSRKTVFQLDTYDEDRQQWISGRSLIRRSKALFDERVRHVAFGPDDFRTNDPRLRSLQKSALRRKP